MLIVGGQIILHLFAIWHCFHFFNSFVQANGQNERNDEKSHFISFNSSSIFICDLDSTLKRHETNERHTLSLLDAHITWKLAHEDQLENVNALENDNWIFFFVKIKTDENGNHLSHDKQNKAKNLRTLTHSHAHENCIQPEN